MVDGFRALNSAQDPQALTEEIASAGVVTTAVGAHILRFVAPGIAAGIEARPAGAPRLTVMACENALNATDLLEEEIRSHFQGEDLDEKALFANTAVDRIVPVQSPESGLDVTVEDFHEWAVERGPFDGHEPDIPGITWVDDLEPYIERKLFTVNTGHATAAWARVASRPRPPSPTPSLTPRCATASGRCWPRPRLCWSPSTASRPRPRSSTRTGAWPGSRPPICPTRSSGWGVRCCESSPGTSGSSARPLSSLSRACPTGLCSTRSRPPCLHPERR